MHKFIYLILILSCLHLHGRKTDIIIDTINGDYLDLTHAVPSSSQSESMIQDTLLLTNSSGTYYYFEIVLGGIQPPIFFQNKIALHSQVKSNDYGIYSSCIPPFSTDTFSYKGRRVQTRDFEIYLKSKRMIDKDNRASLLNLFNAKHFFNYGFNCILFVMLLISFIYFLYLKHTYFIWYSFYLLAIFFFFFIRSVFVTKLFFSDYILSQELDRLLMSMQSLFHVGYFAFVRSFLETKKIAPKIDILCKISIYLSIISLALFILVLNNDQFWSNCFNIYRIAIALLAIINIISGLTLKSKLVNFIAAGSAALLIGSLLAMFYTFYPSYNPLPLWKIHYLQIGVLIELVFFSIGIGYKTFMLNKEKLKVSQSLVASLKENEKILREKESDLEIKIAQASELIMQKQKEQFQTTIELKEKEMEMNLLRSQINPHFMFNTLNALKSLTLQKNTELASQYFDQFSQLMRLILENSRQKKISLENELKTLELYVNLENLRLQFPIDFQIEVDPEIDANYIKIPPTLLQPFVENSIWHGLSHKEQEGGFVKVKINMENDELLISIIDNGIGRDEAEKYKTNSSNHHSLATTIINERLSLANKGIGENIEIIDLRDINGMAIGTEVKLKVILS